jgi:hypothetical protein
MLACFALWNWSEVQLFHAACTNKELGLEDMG